MRQLRASNLKEMHWNGCASNAHRSPWETEVCPVVPVQWQDTTICQVHRGGWAGGGGRQAGLRDHGEKIDSFCMLSTVKDSMCKAQALERILYIIRIIDIICVIWYICIYIHIYIYINIYNIYTYLDASTELDLSPAHIQLVLAEWSPYLQRLSILCHCRSPIPSYRLLLSCNWDTPGNPQVFQQFTTFPGICWLEMIHVVPLAWPAMYLRIEPHRLWSRPWRRHHPPIGFQIYMKCPGANIRLVLVGRPSIM